MEKLSTQAAYRMMRLACNNNREGGAMCVRFRNEKVVRKTGRKGLYIQRSSQMVKHEQAVVESRIPETWREGEMSW